MCDASGWGVHLPVIISPTQYRGPGKKLVPTHLSNKRRDDQGDSVKIISLSKIEFLHWSVGRRLASALSCDFYQIKAGSKLMLIPNKEQLLQSGVKRVYRRKGVTQSQRICFHFTLKCNFLLDFLLLHQTSRVVQICGLLQ